MARVFSVGPLFMLAIVEDESSICEPLNVPSSPDWKYFLLSALGYGETPILHLQLPFY